MDISVFKELFCFDFNFTQIIRGHIVLEKHLNLTINAKVSYDQGHPSGFSSSFPAITSVVTLSVSHSIFFFNDVYLSSYMPLFTVLFYVFL